MWSLALTDAEIASVFSSGVDASSAGLVGLWKFDEGGGQLVTDLSPAGNDGFLGESPSPIAPIRYGRPKMPDRRCENNPISGGGC